MATSFQIGRLAETRGVYDLIKNSNEFNIFVAKCFARYENCDWGELGPEDAKQNDEAVKSGEDRILAAYTHPEHPDWKIWIITERDRSVTTILFPSEY